MDEPVKEKEDVLICIKNSDVEVYASHQRVNGVIINFDELEKDSRGYLCDAYKQLWTLPEAMRCKALPAVIAVIKRRFPIKAKFYPQRFKTTDKIEPDGPPVEFDVTEAVLNQGPDYIDNLRDVHYPTDELADDLPERQAHDGPFAVEIKEAALAFLFADENEEAEEKLKEAERAATLAAKIEADRLKKDAAGWGMSPERLAEINAAAVARCERAARGAATRKKNREAKKEKEKTDEPDS